jgi:hypothetical protein
MAIISDRDPRDGLTFDSMITDRPGHAGELLPKGAVDTTVIPTHGVAVGDRMLLHYMAVLAWGNPGQWTLNESGLAYSDDEGNTWAKDDNATWDGRSNFGQAAVVKWEGGVYLFGIPGGRLGGAKLARVKQDAILDISQYRYFGGFSDGAPQWRADESAAVLIVILRTILVHGFSPKRGQRFSPKGVHWFSAIGGHSFSPKVGHGGGEAPSTGAYFPFCEEREREKRCLEEGRKPWMFERC